MPSGTRLPSGALTAEITALLREHIARKQYSGVEVASAAKIAQSTYSHIINGHKPMDLEQLDRIAWAVGYPLEDLVARAEQNTSNRQASKTWPADRLNDPKRATP